MIKIWREENGVYKMEENGKISVIKNEFDKRIGYGNLKLNENELGIIYVSEKKYEKEKNENGIMEIFEKKERNGNGEKIEKSVKLNWEDFLEEEEKKIVEEIKEKCKERMEKEILMIKYEKMEKEMEEMRKKLGI